METKDYLIERLENLNVGDWDSDTLDAMDEYTLNRMVHALEAARDAGELDLETNAGVDKLQQIVDYYQPTIED